MSVPHRARPLLALALTDLRRVRWLWAAATGASIVVAACASDETLSASAPSLLLMPFTLAAFGGSVVEEGSGSWTFTRSRAVSLRHVVMMRIAVHAAAAVASVALVDLFAWARADAPVAAEALQPIAMLHAVAVAAFGWSLSVALLLRNAVSAVPAGLVLTALVPASLSGVVLRVLPSGGGGSWLAVVLLATSFGPLGIAVLLLRLPRWRRARGVFP